MTIKCLIADDEVIAQQIVEQFILKTPGLTLVAKCKNAIEAFAKLEQYQVDLMFLDIEMPLVNGINFLRTLQKRPKVIFTTAYAEYALEGYDLGVVDYLLKPFSYDRFLQAIQKVQQLMPAATGAAPAQEPETGFLLIKEKEGLIKIRYDDILYIEASKDYMKIFTAATHYLVHQTMKGLESMLPADRFIRTHKSYMVAVKEIRLVKPDMVQLSNNAGIPVSASYKDSVVAAFGRNS
ncbi:MAG: response regulator transcription factor [Bacteroidetes bacterium]|nr:response regulator transcription factor [Bacteroidota bacterium]